MLLLIGKYVVNTINKYYGKRYAATIALVSESLGQRTEACTSKACPSLVLKVSINL